MRTLSSRLLFRPVLSGSLRYVISPPPLCFPYLPLDIICITCGVYRFLSSVCALSVVPPLPHSTGSWGLGPDLRGAPTPCDQDVVGTLRLRVPLPPASPPARLLVDAMRWRYWWGKIDNMRSAAD